MSRWLVERSSAALERRVSRRSFLTKSAIVGSALTVNPLQYILRPGTAYAAICNCAGRQCDCGSGCCDGYTEFCCVVHGSNTCPPGSFPAGWWKADRSPFCSPDGSAPRYYVDCNRCTGCGCGCGRGDCANRRSCCNQFRYGNCNMQIGCTGVIDCRLVTCTPPWTSIAGCTTTTLTDNATRFHDTGCLHPAPPPPPPPSLWHKWWDGGRWSEWEPLGGALTSGPDVASWAEGRLDVFVRGTDNQLWHRVYEGFWSEWEPLGGGLSSDPSAVSWSFGRLDVFVRGTDYQLWHKFYEGGWSSWAPLGGYLTSSPDVASWATGRLDVFVRGTEDGLWHRSYDGGWDDWEPLGGVLTSDPAAVSMAPGRIDVFVRGTDYQLWHRPYEDGWGTWQPLGGYLTSGPDVSSWAPGRLDVFARGTDYGLWHRPYDDSTWRDWQPLGGALTSDPGAVSWSSGRVDVFARGTR